MANVPEPAETLNPDGRSVIIAPATRAGELQQWARVHPGGKLTHQYDCDKLILEAYQLP